MAKAAIQKLLLPTGMAIWLIAFAGHGLRWSIDITYLVLYAVVAAALIEMTIGGRQNRKTKEGGIAPGALKEGGITPGALRYLPFVAFGVCLFPLTPHWFSYQQWALATLGYGALLAGVNHLLATCQPKVNLFTQVLFSASAAFSAYLNYETANFILAGYMGILAISSFGERRIKYGEQIALHLGTISGVHYGDASPVGAAIVVSAVPVVIGLRLLAGMPCWRKLFGLRTRCVPWGGETMWRWVALPIRALFFLLFLSACLQPSGNAVAPENGIATGSARFLLARTSAALLTERAGSVKISVYVVRDDQPQELDGDPHHFSPGGQTSFLVPHVGLGWREFTVEIFNDRNRLIGSTAVRHLVKPGLQDLDMVEIALHDPVFPRVTVPTQVYLSFVEPGQEAPTTYLNVKRMINENCTSCHQSRPDIGPDGGLDTSRFPFLSDLMDDQEEIVNLMIDSMELTDRYRMPPPPKDPAPAEDIHILKQWVSSGLAAFPPAPDDFEELAEAITFEFHSDETSEVLSQVITVKNADGSFAADFSDLILDANYTISIRIIAADGQTTYETTRTGVRTPENTAFQWVIDVPYEEPNVRIPIVVEP